jgi:hypothetical protein
MVRAVLTAAIILISRAQSTEQRTHLSTASSKNKYALPSTMCLMAIFSSTNIPWGDSFAMLLSLHLAGIQDQDFTIVKSVHII